MGIAGFREMKKAVDSGCAFAELFKREEERQFILLKEEWKKSCDMISDWLDSLHQEFLLFFQEFEERKLWPLTHPYDCISTFAQFAYKESPNWSPERVAALQFFQTGPVLSTVRDRMKSHFFSFRDLRDYIEIGVLQQLGIKTRLIPTKKTPPTIAVPPTFACRDLLNTLSKESNVHLSDRIRSEFYTVAAPLPNDCLFFCGGRLDPVILDIRAKTLSKRQQSPEIRIQFGSLYFSDTVYAFGGAREIGTELKSAEKYNLLTDSWTAITAEMADARQYFNPVLHNVTVYIVGGCFSVTAEAFDIPTDTFSLLPFTLPAKFSTLCFVHDGELITVLRTLAHRWKIGSTQVTVSLVWDNVVSSPVNPVMDGKYVFFTTCNFFLKKVFALDVDTLKATKVSRRVDSEKRLIGAKQM